MPPPPAIDLKDDKPFLDMGHTIGHLLQEAREAADEMKMTAANEAAVIIQDAGKEASRMKEETERSLRRAQSEARTILDDARSAAARLGDQIAHEKRLAEAEATVIRREAQREAKGIKDKAAREGESIVQAATGDIADRVRQLEHRLRLLKRAEVELQKRVAHLEDTKKALEADTYALQKEEASGSETDPEVFKFSDL